MEVREKDLKENLEKVGLELRKDSELCRKYIENDDSCEHTLSEIVNIMHEMEFYCKKTPYKVMLKKEKKGLFSQKNKSEWTDEQEEELRNKVKDKVLRNFAFQNKNKEELNNLPSTIIKRIEELTN